MSGFQRIKLIAMREVMTRFRMRAYRITLIVQVVIALLAGLSPIALSYFAGGSSGNEVLVVDSTELGFTDVLQRHLTNDVPGMGAMTVSSFADGADAARDKVKDGDAAAAVIVTEENSTAHYEIVLKNASGLDITSQRVQSAVAASNIEFQAELAGVPADQAAQLVSAPSIVVESPEGESNSIADNFSGPVFAIVNIGLILTYTLFIVYGTWIAQGVVEEKSSRMMEIMVNAATPRDLLMGKVVGVLVAGLGQMLPMIAAAAISFALQPRIADALGVELTSTFDFDLAALSFKAVAVFLVYFIPDHGRFVNVQSHAVPRRMHEIRSKARFFDDVARGFVDIFGLNARTHRLKRGFLGKQDGIVHFLSACIVKVLLFFKAEMFVKIARARTIGTVASVFYSRVEQHEFAVF